MKKYIHLPCSANLAWISPASRRTTAVYSQGDRQHLKPGDTYTFHPAVWHMWSSHKHRHKHRNISHLSLPCHTPSITHSLQGYNRQYAAPPPQKKPFIWGRRLFQLTKNLSFSISQNGITRLITNIVFRLMPQQGLKAPPGDKARTGTLGHLRQP